MRMPFLDREDLGAEGRERFGSRIRWIERRKLVTKAGTVYYTFELTPDSRIPRFYFEEDQPGVSHGRIAGDCGGGRARGPGRNCAGFSARSVPCWLTARAAHLPTALALARCYNPRRDRGIARSSTRMALHRPLRRVQCTTRLGTTPWRNRLTS